MPTKVLSGAATAPAEPVVWRQVSTDDAGADPAAHKDFAEPSSKGEVEVLQARLAQIERDAPIREQQAYSTGYHKGELAGLEQAKAVLDPVADQLARTAADLAQTRRKLRREAEDDVVKLSLAIARRILHRELSIDPDAILGVVKAALHQLEGREIDRLRVSPEDAEVVRRHLESAGAPQRFEIAPDARLGRGCAVFETARGNMDASIDTQLEEIQRGLVDRIRQS
jgi:flagellar assembly protein FliH